MITYINTITYSLAKIFTDCSVQLFETRRFHLSCNAMQGSWRSTRDMRRKILLFFDQGGNWHLCRRIRYYISIFIIMVNFKSSGFDKATGGKSGKFQFDCDGCILLTRRSIIITNSFSFSLYNLPFFPFSIIDCNFGNTWQVFGVKLIDKVAGTLFHSLLLFPLH